MANNSYVNLEDGKRIYIKTIGRLCEDFTPVSDKENTKFCRKKCLELDDIFDLSIPDTSTPMYNNRERSKLQMCELANPEINAIL